MYDEEVIMKKAIRQMLALTLTAATTLGLAGCGGSSAPAAETKSVVVGSKDFTENEIIAEIYALALEDAGFKVDRKMNIAGSVVHTSITSNEIDIYPEYTGTGLITILGMDAMTDQDEVYRTVKDAYNEQFDITWLDYAEANDGQGLFISKKASDEYGITNISQLQANADKLRFCSQGEFDEREDGIPGLTKLYGEFNWKSSRIYDNGLKWEARLTETDKFVLLEDDKGMWPPYNLAPIVRNEVLKQYPEIEEILNAVSATLDTETVTQLNAKVDIEGEEYEDVAAEYFESIKA